MSEVIGNSPFWSVNYYAANSGGFTPAATVSYYTTYGTGYSATEHHSQQDINEYIKPKFLQALRLINKTLIVAEKQHDTKFLLPELYLWKARFLFELGRYKKINRFYSKAMRRYLLSYSKNDNRITNGTLIGMVMFKNVDRQKTIYIAKINAKINHLTTSMLPGFHISDNLLLIIAYANKGELSIADQYYQQAIERYTNFKLTHQKTADYVTEPLMSSHSFRFFDMTYFGDNNQVKKYILYARKIIDFPHIFDIRESTVRIGRWLTILDKILAHKVTEQAVSTYVKKDIFTQNKMATENKYRKTFALIGILNANGYEKIALKLSKQSLVELTWNQLEKNSSLDFMRYSIVLGDVYYANHSLQKAKKQYYSAEKIMQKMDNKHNEYGALIYVPLAEIMVKQNQSTKAIMKTLNKAKYGIEHFYQHSIVHQRYVQLIDLLTKK